MMYREKTTEELLARRCGELLAAGDLETFFDPYNWLWNRFDASEDMRPPKRLRMAKHVAEATYALGLYYYQRMDFIKVCGAYNDLRSLTKSIDNSLDAARCHVQLAMGLFELKLRFSEFENVESYIDELLPVTGRFPENEDFAMASAACLNNLLQLCPYDPNVFFSRMREIFNRIGELAERFSANGELQLCYLRALTFVLIYGKPRLRDEVFEQCYQQTKEAFAAREQTVSAAGLAELRFELRKHGILL